MSKIVSMSSGAIDPIAQTKRVFWRPVTSTTVLKVGQPVCYNSDCVCDHKERTADPTHIGLTEDTYAEGEQEFTGRLFIVEEPLTANLMSFAGIVKSLGPKAGADGDMIEIFTPVDGAVVPVWTDENCEFNRTILGIHNAEVDVSYPGVPIGIAMETKDRATTDGMVWMKFKNFVYDNANETLKVDDEANAVDIHGVYKINVEFIQTSGECTALHVQGKSSAGAGSDGYGCALYVQGDLTGVAASHWNAMGCWANITGGVQTGVHLTVAEFGLYASGANLAAVESVSCLTLRNQVSSTNPPNAVHNIFRIVQDGGGDSADFLFSFYTPETVGLAAESSAAVSHVIPINVENAGGGTAGTYYLMVSDAA